MLAAIHLTSRFVVVIVAIIVAGLLVQTIGFDLKQRRRRGRAGLDARRRGRR
jgi:hypothetical protein